MKFITSCNVQTTYAHTRYLSIWSNGIVLDSEITLVFANLNVFARELVGELDIILADIVGSNFALDNIESFRLACG